MFLILWNYLRGYVIIEVKGFSVERFINLVTYNGIYIWDISTNGASMTMKVSVKGYKQLRPYAKKTRCHIKIKGRVGYPFFVYKYKKRHLFVAGLLIFIMGLYTLSSFVWLINIEGNDRIEDAKILDFCKKKGLTLGTFKPGIDRKQLTEDIKNNFNEISWVTISIKGTRVNIKLAETIPELEIIDNSTPCDIIADKEGLITEIVTRTGTPQVKAKDVVEVGDVLIAGELIITEDENGTVKSYTHSDGDIKAKIIKNYDFEIPLTYYTKDYTENKKTYYNVNIFNKNFTTNFAKNNISFEKYDKIDNKLQLSLGEDFPLPIIITKTRYNEYIPKEQKLTIEQAKAKADKILTQRILSEYPIDSDIIDKSVDYISVEDKLQVKAKIISIENIGVEQSINNIEGSNAINGGTENTNTE